MIAGSRDVGVSPSIVGSFSRKEAALVEVYPQGRMSHHFREMCVGDHLAVKFEWAWQHPRESRAVREAAAAFKSFPGLARKIKLAYTMLTLPAWNILNLTVNYFSSKYAHHSGVSPSLPPHMKVPVCAMGDLPCFTKGDNDSQPEDEVSLDSNEEENDNNTQSQPRNPTTSSLDVFLIINLYFYFSYVFISYLFKCYEIQ
ncbi:structure-specific endonuclease subunit SLX1 isoform X1 [Brassica napus]|uniref:structure-specific endonuclease subunit SLX1 isoform X1 n=1 Tax=Brassica napus TaxID=3708 RepID=UPI0020799476|nr:structure-specific endonuclease subunit SLX1 isoform X1 [Brassica napus]